MSIEIIISWSISTHHWICRQSCYGLCYGAQSVVSWKHDYYSLKVRVIWDLNMATGRPYSNMDQDKTNPGVLQKMGEH